ncbi:MAG: nucleotide exchange factor GrpE [Armatimonadetes bacterium RBG_16_58_9]|nr:MAG: nucleotide exchange factor GrpE [Armatimonadetes bacterium RBG_16_58_9]
MKRRVPIDLELSDEAMEAAEEQELPMEEEIEPDKLTAEIAAMQRELEQIKSDAEESHDRYLRALADFDNFRKRQREETERRAQLAREELILKLLPIMDNFERALAAAEEQHSYDSLVEGVSLTLRQMNEMLSREGVEPIEAVGGEFDPRLHEAMVRMETDDYPENTVVDELEKGYMLNGKVLRPSRVRVATSD